MWDCVVSGAEASLLIIMPSVSSVWQIREGLLKQWNVEVSRNEEHDSGLEKHCLQDHLLDARRAFWNFYFYPLCKIFLVRVNYSNVCIYCTNKS